MALYRTIQTTLWSDTKVEDEFTPEDKLFFVYLLTNNRTSLCGCYEISVRQMSRELGLSKESVYNLIERFSKFHNVIRYSEENKEVLVLNWYKYHWSKSPKTQEAVFKGIKEIKTPEFSEMVIRIYDNYYTENEGEIGCGINAPSMEHNRGIYASASANAINNIVIDNNLELNNNTTLSNSINNTLSKDIVRVNNIQNDKVSYKSVVDSIVSMWNELSNYGIPSVRKVDSKSARYRTLISTIKDYGEEDIRNAIEKVKASTFLLGENRTGWAISFDWFIKKSNLLKILEGNYDNKVTVERPGNVDPFDKIAREGI